MIFLISNPNVQKFYFKATQQFSFFGLMWKKKKKKKKKKKNP